MAGNWPDRGVTTFDLPQSLAAGVVAHNEEGHLRAAVRSLVDQQLPEGVTWREIWVVASGCTDRTVEVARDLADEEPRVQVVVEPDRGGKARALRQVFLRAKGDALVLLNSDARAEPGAVDQLVRTAAGKRAPFAVMGRPVVPGHAPGRWAPTFRWMWDLHHEYHAELLADGAGGHLSDELLLVSLPTVPPVPEGIINDGSYLAVWLAQHAGGRWYAPDARVSIQVPSEVRDHLRQRRRIHVGNQQVASVLGAPPTTLAYRFAERPIETVRLLRRMLRQNGGFGHFSRVVTWELISYALAVWDRLPPRKDHVRWDRIRVPSVDRAAAMAAPVKSPTESPGMMATERRVASLLGVAKEFGTGVRLPELLRLLPNDAPASIPEFREWLETRPDLARLEGELAFAPEATPSAERDRLELGHHYLRAARSLLTGPLRGPTAMSRCICVTGSAAYGVPHRGDDLDLFVVTPNGGLWWFLAYSYLCVRVARWRHSGSTEATPCFNFVLEDRAALEEFSRDQGFLFAREALTAQPVHGADYYRGLLSHGRWMREEIPRFYDDVNQGPVEPGHLSGSAPILVRLLSLAVFPWVATYLQLVGLRRNRGFRRTSMSDHQFHTETRLRRLAFASRKFERLRQSYRAPTDSPPNVVSEAGAWASNGPAQRGRPVGRAAAPPSSD